MKTKDFGKMVFQLAKPGQEIAEQMTGHAAHLIHMVLGISGESGELLDAVKKAVIYQKCLDLDNVIEELGDIEFYMEGLRQGLGITREQVLLHNMHKLSGVKGRYKDGYSDAQAQNRLDKQS